MGFQSRGVLRSQSKRGVGLKGIAAPLTDGRSAPNGGGEAGVVAHAVAAALDGGPRLIHNKAEAYTVVVTGADGAEDAGRVDVSVRVWPAAGELAGGAGADASALRRRGGAAAALAVIITQADCSARRAAAAGPGVA